MLSSCLCLHIMHHSINMQNHSFHKRLSCLRLHTDFCDYVNSFPRDIQRLCCETTDLGELPAGSGNQLPTFLNSENLHFFCKICQAFWVNLPVSFWEVCHQLRKSIAYFGKIRHRLWGNPPPTLFKSATDFGKMSHRLWENQPPTFRKAVTDFGEMPSPILASLCI